MFKIKKISIAGFRGFNNKKSIDIDNNLTIIYGPNSYGKTSISEALEWLLFGVTSKVQESVTGKTEFKGTYRNIHYKGENKPFVELILQDNGEQISLRGELNEDDTIDRYLHEEPIDDWPWYKSGLVIYSPFILQHALQDFLLSTPSTRYSKMSEIMGTQVLEEFQNVFNSLATKYKPPFEVQRFLDKIESYLNKYTEEEFIDLVKAIKKKDLPQTIDEINDLVSYYIEVEELPVIDPDNEINQKILDILIEERNQKVSTIFDKEVTLSEISDQEREFQSTIIGKISLIDTKEVIDQYLEYARLKARQEFVKLAKFYSVGLEINETHPEQCPFCGTILSDDIKEHIKERHNNLQHEISLFEDLKEEKKSFIEKIDNFKKDIEKYYLSLNKKLETLSFLDNENDKSQLKEIFGEEELISFEKLYKIIDLFQKALASFEEKKQKVDESLEVISQSFSQFNQTTDHIKNLRKSLSVFLSSGKEVSELIDSNVSIISEIADILERKLNLLAGTKNLAKFILLVQKYGDIKKYIPIIDAIDSMKDLRSSVTEFVSEKTISLIEDQLTEEVMNWYKQIKTEGDPDVHFSGFSLGGTKSRHEIAISASSYGQDLVSAVSSLSESKLNALGLSMKIANSLKENNPFGFLIIDDPVQSLDEHHECQIITIIRKLVDEHKRQVILLSHNKKWLDQLKKGCESLNGIYYEITGFDKTGPELEMMIWKTWERRLRDVNSMCEVKNSSSINLQRAEEEIRLAVCEITSLLYEKEKGQYKSPHNFNSSIIRELLIECDVPIDLIDRIGQTFVTTDPSHHPSEDYVANRQRIKNYHSWAHELGNLLK